MFRFLSITLFVILASVSASETLPKEFPKCGIVSDADNQEHPAPDFIEALEGNFSLLVEMTMMKQNLTYYIEEVRERGEYQGIASNSGAVYMLQNGTETVYHYYPDTGTFIEDRDGVCRDAGTGMPPFNPWGWWDPDPDHGDMQYGPSSLIRMSHFINKRFLGGGDRLINGVRCERWEACEGQQSIVVYYYYAKKPWEMWEAPFFDTGEGRIPIQIEVMFLDDTERIQYNILSFLPFVTRPTLTETPRGESCEGMVGVVVGGGVHVPRIPTHFSFFQEILYNPSIDGVNLGRQHLHKFQVSYSEPLSVTRLDYKPEHPDDTPFLTTSQLKIIHDFNTGVEYVINREFGNCTRNRISSSFFDSHFNGMLATGGNMVGPNQLFHLDDSFSFVGLRDTRGMQTQFWTATRSDIPDPDSQGLQNYPKAVLEYYFIKTYESTPEGTEEVNTPVRADLYVYNSSDPQQVIKMTTSNFYDFNVIRIYEQMEFTVEECFERLDDDWSYLIISFPANKDNQMEAVEENQDLFRDQVFSLVTVRGQMSPTRIASIDLTDGLDDSGGGQDLSSKVVLASIKVLEKAPYIFSYSHLEDDPDLRPGINEKSVEDIIFAEDCAELCSLEKSFKCQSFHHCDDHICYLSKTQGSDGKPVDTVTKCDHMIYDVANQSFADVPSSDAYNNILEAISHNLFIVYLKYEGKDVELSATDALHYQTPDPLAPLRSQFVLKDRRTSLAVPDDKHEKIDSLDDCMGLCVAWRAYRCETISYLWEEKECRISASHYEEMNSTAFRPHSKSDVYVRTYLSEYKPIFGGVALNTSGPAYSNVDHVETCARYCSEDTEIDCRSFEWCHQEKVCHLHSERFIDVVDGGNYVDQTSCIHFSKTVDATFSLHPRQGMSSKQHVLVATKSDASACANLCLKSTTLVCESFDFCSTCEEEDAAVCGHENEGLSNICFIGEHHLGEPDARPKAAPHCEHYSREYFGDLDYANWVATQRQSDHPYTPGAMVGMALGMILLGALLSLGFLYILVKTGEGNPHPESKEVVMSYIDLQTSSGETDT